MRCQLHSNIMHTLGFNGYVTSEWNYTKQFWALGDGLPSRWENLASKTENLAKHLHQYHHHQHHQHRHHYHLLCKMDCAWKHTFIHSLMSLAQPLFHIHLHIRRHIPRRGLHEHNGHLSWLCSTKFVHAAHTLHPNIIHSKELYTVLDWNTMRCISVHCLSSQFARRNMNARVGCACDRAKFFHCKLFAFSCLPLRGMLFGSFPCNWLQFGGSRNALECWQVPPWRQKRWARPPLLENWRLWRLVMVPLILHHGDGDGGIDLAPVINDASCFASIGLGLDTIIVNTCKCHQKITTKTMFPPPKV